MKKGLYVTGLYLFMLFALGGCSIGQLKAPQASEKPGAIIISMYFVKTSSSGEVTPIESASLREVALVEINDKTGEAEYSGLEGENRVIFGYNVVALTGYEPGKKYSIGYVELEQNINNVKTIHQYKVDYKKGFAEAPVIGKKGEVQFGGIYGLNVKVLKESTLTSPEVVNPQIVKGGKLLTGLSEKGLWGGYATWAKNEVYGYGSDYSDKAAEKNALKTVYTLQHNEYWKNAIEKALKKCKC